MKKILATSICIFVLAGASAVYAVDGFAAENGGTTGGEGGTVVTVDNAADLIYYVQSTRQDPYIIYVSGNIDLGGSNVRVRGNKTIIGLPGSHITGNLKCFRSEESNNIFRYLDMDNQGKSGDGDCISIDGVSNVWVDHCTFTDGGDGCVDIKNGADYVTVSWCKFQYTDSGSSHRFTNLIGHSDSNGGTDSGHLRVTFHHNWYSSLCHERMPSVRFGKAHVYNTYFDCPGNRYCIRTRLYAQCRVENNYFKGVQNPWERYVTDSSDDPGLLYASGNVFDDVSWYVGYDSKSELIDGTDTVFTPPYAYTLHSAEQVPAIVQAGAGAEGQEGTPPDVEAGDDQVTWLGYSGTAGQEIVYLDGTTSHDTSYTVLWAQIDNGAPTVTISPNDVDETSVTITAEGTYEFKLTADDGTSQAFDTVEVIVGEDSCHASHLSTSDDYSPSDFNHDCIVNIQDIAQFITNWLNCTNTLESCH